MTCAVNSRWLNYGTEWEQYFDYINLMSYDRGAFTDKPVQHASYDDFVKDLKYWNEQCRASKSKIVGGLPFMDIPGRKVCKAQWMTFVESAIAAYSNILEMKQRTRII